MSINESVLELARSEFEDRLDMTLYGDSADFCLEDYKLLQKKAQKRIIQEALTSRSLLYSLLKYREVAGNDDHTSLVFFSKTITVYDPILFARIFTNSGFDVIEADDYIFLRDADPKAILELSKTMKTNNVFGLNYNIDRLEKYHSWIKSGRLSLSKSEKFSNSDYNFLTILNANDNIEINETNYQDTKALFQRIMKRLDRDKENGFKLHYKVGSNNGFNGCRLTIYSDSLKNLNFLKLMGMSEYKTSIPHDLVIGSNKEFDDFFEPLM